MQSNIFLRPSRFKKRPLRILSLGAGVQSTTLLLQALCGDIEPIDAAIFADTGWEPDEVYEHLGMLREEAAKFGVPLITVSAGNIRDDHIDPQHPHLFIRKPRKHPEWQGKQRTFIPFYVINPDGTSGKTYRTCTKTYKIEPVEKMIRHLLGLKPRQPWPKEHAIDQLFGISWDETERMRDPSIACIKNHYPLVDQRMTRDGCHTYMASKGWTAPRSACVGCPFHSNEEWRKIRARSEVEFKEAVEFDATMRQRHVDGKLPLEGEPFIHSQRIPLDQVDLGTDTEPGWEEECQGYCGV